MIAKVTPDTSKPERYFTGHSQADEKQGMVYKTAALENCETSAVGRALAMMGIGVIDSIASVDEMKKANVASLAPQQMNLPGEKCPKCGAPMKISNKGSKYCSALCWKEQLKDKVINEY
jgi:hypothetical protein